MLFSQSYEYFIYYSDCFMYIIFLSLVLNQSIFDVALKCQKHMKMLNKQYCCIHLRVKHLIRKTIA